VLALIAPVAFNGEFAEMLFDPAAEAALALAPDPTVAAQIGRVH
jgi:hypothetical protein